MAFYDLSKEERKKRVQKIGRDLLLDLQNNSAAAFRRYYSDEDTYIRKAAYLNTGRLFFSRSELQSRVLNLLAQLYTEKDFRIRQTVINAAGEIGKQKFKKVREFFDKGLHDAHHSPRNAVIGSIKKMGEVNPQPVLSWASAYLHHPHAEIRREICHGIELRGRTHPQDILPLLKELEFDTSSRVRNTLVHVLGQIAYKKDCLAKVVEHLRSWKNKALVQEALEEVIDVHDRYRDFSVLSQKEAKAYIESHF